MIAETECSERVRAPEFALVARRNNSLSSAGRLLVFAFIFVVSVGIAATFAFFGAWLVLPFAGVEMLVLFWAFRYMDRHSADYERIAIDGGRVEVELFEAGRTQRHELSRCWARVVIDPDGSRLALRSHGREIEIGRYLSEGQRRDFAHSLDRRLRGAG